MDKIIKNNWQTKKLGDVCDFQNGFAFKSKLFKETGFPVLRISNIQNDGISYNRLVFFDKKNYKEDFDKYQALKGDLVIAMSGATTGKLAICDADEIFYLNQRVGKFKPKKDLSNDYLYYFLSTRIEENLKISAGSAQPNLSTEQIKSFKIPLPPLPEQHRIVKILDEVFDKTAKAKENAEKKIQQAKALFESYLQSVFTNPEYEIKTLGELCDSVEYGSSSKSKSTGKISVLRMGNIQEGRFNWDNLVYSDDDCENKKYLLKYNDVLFNRTNSPELVGKTAVYKGEMPAIFAGYLIRINRKENLLDADYLNYFLNSNIAKDYGKTVVISSVNQANINGTKLKNYPIPTPSLSEQKDIVAKLDTLSTETKKLEAIYKQKLADLAELKKSVLKKAFNGEL
ncbi:restriction endonuclease [bacterium]|nr:restriction endonuclease [bacterium]